MAMLKVLQCMVSTYMRSTFDFREKKNRVLVEDHKLSPQTIVNGAHCPRTIDKHGSKPGTADEMG